MRAPHGPYRIAKNGQVVLGREVLAISGLQPGDAVYLVPQDRPEGTILVIPVEIAVRWFERGREADKDSAVEDDEGAPRGSPPDPSV